MSKINKSFNEKSQIPNMPAIEYGPRSLQVKNRKKIEQIIESEKRISKKLNLQIQQNLMQLQNQNSNFDFTILQKVVNENQVMKSKLINNGEQIQKLLSKIFFQEVLKQQEKSDVDEPNSKYVLKVPKKYESPELRFSKRKRIKNRKLILSKKMYRRRIKIISQKLKSAQERKKKMQNQKIYRIMLNNDLSYKRAMKRRRKRKVYLERGGQQFEIIQWRQKGRSFIQEQKERSRISQIQQKNDLNILNELSKSRIQEQPEYQEEDSRDMTNKYKNYKRNIKSKKLPNRKSREKSNQKQVKKSNTYRDQNEIEHPVNQNLQQHFSDINNFKQVDRPYQNNQFFPDQFQPESPPNMYKFQNESPPHNYNQIRMRSKQSRRNTQEDSSKRTLESSQQQNVLFRPQYQPHLIQKKQIGIMYNQNQQFQQQAMRPQVRMAYHHQRPYPYFPPPQRRFPMPQQQPQHHRMIKVKPNFPPSLYDHDPQRQINQSQQKNDVKSEFQEGNQIDEQQELEQALEEGNNSKSIEQEDSEKETPQDESEANEKLLQLEEEK